MGDLLPHPPFVEGRALIEKEKALEKFFENTCATLPPDDNRTTSTLRGVVCLGCFCHAPRGPSLSRIVFNFALSRIEKKTRNTERAKEVGI